MLFLLLLFGVPYLWCNTKLPATFQGGTNSFSGVAGQHELNFNLFMYFVKRKKGHEVVWVGKWTLRKLEKGKRI